MTDTAELDLEPATEHLVIGIDPGPVPGLALLEVESGHLRRAEVLQCSHGLCSQLVDALLLEQRAPALIAVEKFVVGRRASRSSTAKAGEQTRDLIGQLQRVVTAWGPGTQRAGARLVQRPAAAVKTWATDHRLENANDWTGADLLGLTKGLRHARDASRHALFAASQAGLLPDPLGRGWSR